MSGKEYTKDSIIGLWSVDVMYIGAQEDDLLAFRPDGTGWFAFIHYELCELETFSWSLAPDGTLTISTIKSFVVGDKDNPNPREYDRGFLPATCSIVSIEKEATPSDVITEVITFDRTVPSSNKYGLLTRDPSRLEPPSFEDNC